MALSKVALWTLYSIKAKVAEMETCYYINFASFIETNKLIKKIGITNWLRPGNVSFEETNWYNKTALEAWLYKIVFEFI